MFSIVGTVESVQAADPPPCLVLSKELALPPLDRTSRFSTPKYADPLIRNTVINRDYRMQALALNAYLGYPSGTSGAANWWALAHSASNTAGRTIEVVSAALKVLDDLIAGNLNDIEADKGYAKLLLATPGMPANAVSYGRAKLEEAYRTKNVALLNAIRDDFRNIYVGFVAGNLAIYREVGELMTPFLTEAAASPTCTVNVDGLRSPSAWAATDPSGLVRAGLQLLVQARTVADPAKRAELVHKSSLFIGFQEQWMLQLKVYDKFKLAPIFESFRVDLVDAHGAFKLVDENWAEFTVRMGIRSKGKALTRLEFDKAWKRVDNTYKFSPTSLPSLIEGAGAGTIPAYFRDRLVKAPASKMFETLEGPKRIWN